MYLDRPRDTSHECRESDEAEAGVRNCVWGSEGTTETEEDGDVEEDGRGEGRCGCDGDEGTDSGGDGMSSGCDCASRHWLAWRCRVD